VDRSATAENEGDPEGFLVPTLRVGMLPRRSAAMWSWSGNASFRDQGRTQSVR